jgi:hypothetical protein
MLEMMFSVGERLRKSLWRYILHRSVGLNGACAHHFEERLVVSASESLIHRSGQYIPWLLFIAFSLSGRYESLGVGKGKAGELIHSL